jgi:hypothetical protein
MSRSLIVGVLYFPANKLLGGVMSESSRQFDRRAFLRGSVAILATEQSGGGRPPVFHTCGRSVHRV